MGKENVLSIIISIYIYSGTQDKWKKLVLQNAVLINMVQMLEIKNIIVACLHSVPNHGTWDNAT